MSRKEKNMLIDPPRADYSVASADLPFLERQREFLAQVKRNGSYTVIDKRPNGKIVIKNRHGVAPKAWYLNDDNGVKSFFERLPPGIYCSELLHSQVKNVRDTHYFHDILSVDGELLLGKTYQERYEKLSDIMFSMVKGKPRLQFGHYIIDKNIWLAKNYLTGFRSLFNTLSEGMDEGIVLKRFQHRLSIKNDPSWSFKCRRFDYLNKKGAK
jgi:hypothetical protein